MAAHACLCRPAEDVRVGKPLQLICPAHGRRLVLTPQGRLLLKGLPAGVGLKLVSVEGSARCGKTTLVNDMAAYINSFNAPDRRVDLAPMATGDGDEPVTIGIQVVVVPDPAGGHFLLFDVEGKDLGDDSLHQLQLALMSTVVGQTLYVQVGAPTNVTLQGIGRMASARLGIKGGLGNTHPDLWVVINQNVLRVRPDAMQRLLADVPDHHLNETRAAIRQLWPTVNLHCVGAGLEQPSTVQQLRGLAQAVYDRARPLTAAWTMGRDEPASAWLDGPALWQYLKLLVDTVNKSDLVDPTPALQATLETMIRARYDAALAQYFGEVGQDPTNVREGLDDVDGARGTADDSAAARVKAQVAERLGTLARCIARLFADGTENLCITGSTRSSRDELADRLRGELERDMRKWHAHFDRMRAIVSTTTVHHATERTPKSEFHSKEGWRIGFWQEWNYHYNYRRWDEVVEWHRTKYVRRNGDVFFGPPEATTRQENMRVERGAAPSLEDQLRSAGVAPEAIGQVLEQIEQVRRQLPPLFS